LFRIRDVNPGSEFSVPDPGSKKIPDPDSHQRIYLFLSQTLKTVSKLSENVWDVHIGSRSRIRIRIFIHPGSWIRIPNTGCKKHRISDPDPQHCLQICECRAVFFYREGKFKRLGLSNYSAWEVARTMEICGREGWLQPTVYQADRSPAVFFKRDSPARLERPESV
jgi:hypothetical protein